ncbi:DUF1330 domain-containing protein [Aurantiacibacter odishensis]|uniref:DUF1330 domain-containing protein n=1 Tax=Aurantiacibacter odishensis TaxID=1155476 RepID=UPI0013C49093|nr:DUF1330 domain-containing protein [Aurantiacibacter odishensis]
MPGYIIAHYKITDAEGIGNYVEAVMPILTAHGGEALVVDGDSQVMEGDAPHQSVVVKFPSVEAAKGFYNSAEYQAVRHFRTDNSTAGSLVIVEGVEGPE